MTPFGPLTSRVVSLPLDDIDTDQIIPARFLKVTDKRGLGEHLFSAWRDTPDFPLAAPRAKGAQILLAGANFGCGSSREHAPWALVDAGFRAVIARSFADIFRQNATKNGLLPIALDDAAYARLRSALAKDPELAVTVDLAAARVSFPGGDAATFAVDPFAKRCLLQGLDELAYILEFSPQILAHETERRS
jgi:3-isopropylmalate/(R)-2-methylmalate dehydratase small subunit